MKKEQVTGTASKDRSPSKANMQKLLKYILKKEIK
jgi:hypothetical protein